jgi:quinol monooxygenase YgiN
MPDSSVADDRVTVAGHFIINPGAIDTVLALWAELIEHVRVHEPGTELYLLEQDVADPSQLWLHEIYQDEAAFEAHGHSQVVRDFVDRLTPLIAETHLAQTRRLLGVDRPA